LIPIVGVVTAGILSTITTDIYNMYIA